jgi:tetratricopeptide (TPR) repeat protein
MALAVTAYRQVGYWQDNVTLWSHTLEVTDGNFLAENNLGKMLLSQGHLEEGVAHFYKAAEIYPSDPVSNLNIGLYEQKRGNWNAAIARYKITVSVTRDNELKIAALRNMATAYRSLGDSANAEQSMEEAARLRH